MGLDNINYTSANTITLNQSQLQSGIYQAAQRDNQSRSFNHSHTRGIAEDKGESARGSLGEVAAHVKWNLPFEYSINKWSSPDLITPKGKQVDIKTEINSHTLYISPRHLHPDWYYFHVYQIDQYTYAFIGWIKGDKVSQYPLKDIGKRGSLVFCVPASALSQKFN